mmetsp:Transcript_100501/g.292958  ORF Transcript_100501/g.292958 Transcript_100501/m.292958 type:complete len:563 (+) Transcript_100501:87-1775(+)
MPIFGGGLLSSKSLAKSGSTSAMKVAPAPVPEDQEVEGDAAVNSQELRGSAAGEKIRPSVWQDVKDDMGHPYASFDAVKDEHDDDQIPKRGSAARHVLRMIQDRHLLESKETLNTSSYVNVFFEEEEMEAAKMGLKINLADQTVYPESFKMHNNVLNMVARLWHCPVPVDMDEYGSFPGAGTVGSTEACLLAGLCMKFRWREWYKKKFNKNNKEVRGVFPNLIISTCFQACWEKLFRYMDIEPKFVTPSYKTFAMSAEDVRPLIDENTIGVVAILGNHYGGQYDPVWEIDAMLQEFNKEKGMQVGIHVDAASGGFTAPFQPEVPAWDFRLPTVISISASGHKFGESCCGTGWIVWRRRQDLSENVAISVSYLGGKADSYTLNFSRPAQGVYVQFYKLLRLGCSGYKDQVANQMAVSQFIREGFMKMTHRDTGKPLFTVIDAVGQSSQKLCLPVVTAMFTHELSLSYDEIDLQHIIAQGHWYVSGYHMSMHHPLKHTSMPLFHDQPTEQAMFRVVVKNNLTMAMANHLLREVATAVAFLQMHDEGFHHKKPRLEKGTPTKSAC